MGIQCYWLEQKLRIKLILLNQCTSLSDSSNSIGIRLIIPTSFNSSLNKKQTIKNIYHILKDKNNQNYISLLKNLSENNFSTFSQNRARFLVSHHKMHQSEWYPIITLQNYRKWLIAFGNQTHYIFFSTILRINLEHKSMTKISKTISFNKYLGRTDNNNSILCEQFIMKFESRYI